MILEAKIICILVYQNNEKTIKIKITSKNCLQTSKRVV